MLTAPAEITGLFAWFFCVPKLLFSAFPLLSQQLLSFPSVNSSPAPCLQLWSQMKQTEKAKAAKPPVPRHGARSFVQWFTHKHRLQQAWAGGFNSNTRFCRTLKNIFIRGFSPNVILGFWQSKSEPYKSVPTKFQSLGSLLSFPHERILSFPFATMENKAFISFLKK